MPGDSLRPESFDQWFQPLVDSNNQDCLVCFPYAGSGAAMFGKLRNSMGPGVDLFATKLPGRESRLNESPHEDLKRLADEIAEAIASSPLGQRINDTAVRLSLLGCSLGALLAFEVARSLRRRQVKINYLFAAAARAPHKLGTRSSIHKLPDLRFLKKLHQRYRSVPQQMMNDEDFRQRMLPMLRADAKMFETYRYAQEPRLDCQLVTMSGKEDRTVKPNHVYAWKELATSFRHRSFSGNHYFLRTQTESVVQTIQRRLHLT